MVAQTREQDVLAFMEIANESPVESAKDIHTVLVPAFITSELKTAFTIGFLIYILYNNRSGRCEHTHVNGYDDVITDDDIVAFQATLVRAG